MRFLSVACSVLVLTGPAFGQHLALTPAKPDCAPGDPDSLQISWTTPCDSGNWLFDTQTGCRMWDWHPDPEDKAVWKGACRAGQPDGRGEAQWFEHGRPIDHFVGTYRQGKREGAGYYKWNDSVSFEGSYANDLPQGRGSLRIDDLVLTGVWNKGCLATGGKVAAIAVPRVTCGLVGNPKPKVADR